MGTESVALAVFIDYFCSSKISSDRVGDLGVFSLLHYFRNCDIKDTGLIHFFRSLRAILTKLLIVCTYIKLMNYYRIDDLK